MLGHWVETSMIPGLARGAYTFHFGRWSAIIWARGCPLVLNPCLETQTRQRWTWPPPGPPLRWIPWDATYRAHDNRKVSLTAVPRGSPVWRWSHRTNFKAVSLWPLTGPHFWCVISLTLLDLLNIHTVNLQKCTWDHSTHLCLIPFNSLPFLPWSPNVLACALFSKCKTLPLTTWVTNSVFKLYLLNVWPQSKYLMFLCFGFLTCIMELTSLPTSRGFGYYYWLSYYRSSVWNNSWHTKGAQ